MGEIIFLKLLPIIVTVAITDCCLPKVTQDVKKIEECKNLLKIKEIEMWLTKVNMEEIAVRATGKVPAEDVCAAPPQVEGCNIEDMPDYKSPFVEETSRTEENNNTVEGSFTKWHVKATHQAAKLLNENKVILANHNKTALRLLHLYSIAGALYHSELQKRRELKKLKDDMQNTFFGTINNKSKVSRHRPREYKLDLKPQSCSILKCMWESWHNEVGTAVRDNFKKIVELSNEAAKENGYKDAGEVWKIFDVEDTNAEQEMKRLLDGVMPLYEQLHAYVRRKIANYYSNVVYCRDPPKPEDPIPAHLTGNLIGKEWSQLESMVLPYPEVTPADFSESMNSSKPDQNDMAHEAEKFFISLGFRPMPKEFWHNSTFKSTGDRTFGCAPRVYDDFDGSGYRMFVCANLTVKDIVVIHRGMGYIAGRMESEHLPYKFRFGLSKIIVDALGDSLALSITTPDHLEMIFNLSKGDWNDELKNVSAMEFVTKETLKEQTVTQEVTTELPVTEEQKEKATPTEQEVMVTEPPATSVSAMVTEEAPKEQTVAEKGTAKIPVAEAQEEKAAEVMAPVTTVEHEIGFTKHPTIKMDLNEKLDDGEASKKSDKNEELDDGEMLEKCDQYEEPNDEDMLKKRDINALMRSALLMLPLLPYSYVLEIWRYQVFSGNITPEEYNRSWWNMRMKYQGIVPPVQRSDCNFDPGAIVHISLNMPYGNNFFSLFVAYQIHETLCKLSKHEGPLHHCDIYQSKDAGQKLRDILKQGGSKPTVELLKELTCGDGYKYEPILRYYEPLHDWLKEQNKGHTVEWNKNFKTE